MKIKMKILTLSLAATMLCSAGTALAESNGYSDVSEQSPYYEAIMYMTDAGVFAGVSETEFAPEAKLTRGMFVTLLERVNDNLNGSDGAPNKSDFAKTSFKDVAVSDYYCAAVSWAHENGIVSGCSDEIFAPNDCLTKQQAVTILHRFSEYAKDEFSSGNDTNILSYEDYKNISEYAIPSIQWGLENDIIGDNGTKINADETVTRAQAAQYLYNYMEKRLNSRSDSETEN